MNIINKEGSSHNVEQIGKIKRYKTSISTSKSFVVENIDNVSFLLWKNVVVLIVKRAFTEKTKYIIILLTQF